MTARERSHSTKKAIIPSQHEAERSPSRQARTPAPLLLPLLVEFSVVQGTTPQSLQQVQTVPAKDVVAVAVDDVDVVGEKTVVDVVVDVDDVDGDVTDMVDDDDDDEPSAALLVVVVEREGSVLVVVVVVVDGVVVVVALVVEVALEVVVEVVIVVPPPAEQISPGEVMFPNPTSESNVFPAVGSVLIIEIILKLPNELTPAAATPPKAEVLSVRKSTREKFTLSAQPLVPNLSKVDGLVPFLESKMT